MKILFIDFNARYINPTNSLIPPLLKLVGKTAFFGPGFVSDDVLEKGVEAFADSFGPFDIVATTSQIAIKSDPHETGNFYRQNSVHNWGAFPLDRFMSDARSFMLRAKGIRLCFVMDLDTYATGAGLLELLNETSTHIVGFGEGFTRSNEELAYLNQEVFYKRKADKHEFGLWHDFVKDNRHKFINMGHFIGEQEFYWGPLDSRKYSASVPGQLYVARLNALKALKRNKGLRIGGTSYKPFFSLMAKLGLRPYARSYLHLFYNSQFMNVLKNSTFTVTDGCGYDMPLRKFFEVPATGSILLARPCAGFEALGFVHGSNAFVLDEENPADQVIQLLKDTNLLQTIADKGRELVWNRHSLPARADQLRRSLDSAMAGTFAGSHWHDGEFIVENRA